MAISDKNELNPFQSNDIETSVSNHGSFDWHSIANWCSMLLLLLILLAMSTAIGVSIYRHSFNKPVFQAGSLVYVMNGFYAGHRGQVRGHSVSLMGSNSYLVRLHSFGPYEHSWIDECDLK